MRIVSIIIFHLSTYKAKFFILYDVIFLRLPAGEILKSITLGERVNLPTVNACRRMGYTVLSPFVSLVLVPV